MCLFLQDRAQPPPLLSAPPVPSHAPVRRPPVHVNTQCYFFYNHNARREKNGVAITRTRAVILCLLCGTALCMAKHYIFYTLPSDAHKLLAQAAPKTARFGPFFCAFLTVIAPPISPELCGPPTGLTNVREHPRTTGIISSSLVFAFA
jgi:hypothetical protein